jgi:multidrug transporter EmrE-like cation transporter
VTAAGWVWILICAAAAVVANFLLRIGVSRSGVTLLSGGFGGLQTQVLSLARQPALLAAFVLYGIAMLAWLRVSATERLSTAYPTLATLTFVGVTAVGVLLFGEPTDWRKLLGLLLLVGGLYLISAT